MTLRLSIEEILARAAERRRQRAARDAALRDRGVTPLPPPRKTVLRSPARGARLLPWRRRED